jgi:hypothetical protein
MTYPVHIANYTTSNIAVDGQSIQTPHPWVVGYPLSPKFQSYGFVSLFLILGFVFLLPFEGANQSKKNNIVIGGAGGYWITRVWIIRPSPVRGAVVSRSAENVKGNFS